MCDPVLIASIAATAAGTLLNNRTENQYIDETNRQRRIAEQAAEMARQREQGRQDDYAQQRMQLFQQATETADPGATRIAAEQAGREQAENVDRTADDFTITTLPADSDAPGPLARIVGERLSDEARRTRGQIEAMTQLTGTRLGSAGTRRDLRDLFGQNARIADAQTGSRQVAQQEQAIRPARVTPSQSPLGDLLIMGGQLGSMYAGLQGAGSPVAPEKAPLPPRRPG